MDRREPCRVPRRLLIFRGIFMVLSIPIDPAARGWSIALGVLEASVGVAVWIWRGPTLLVIAGFVGWYLLFGGIMAITTAVGGRDVIPYSRWLLAYGIVETLFSFWLLARPGLTLYAAVLAIGLWTLVYGVVVIALSLEIKRSPSRLALVGTEGSARTSIAAARVS